MNYEQEQLNKLPNDVFYKIKVSCAFEKGETKVLNISPQQFKQLKKIFKDSNKKYICNECHNITYADEEPLKCSCGADNWGVQ